MADAGGTTYEKRRAKEGERQRKLALSGRDIGPIPNIKNVRRRAKCERSLKLFLETYVTGIAWDWSPDHLEMIERLEEVAFLAAMQAMAEPRGWGKSALCRGAVAWTVSYRHRRYPFLIGATDQKACEAVEFIQKLFRFGETYRLDFPEISHAARHLGGIANRAAGQVCQGEPTLIKWAADRIVLPRVPPPKNWPKSWDLAPDGMVPTSCSIVGASGLTGEGIRGSVETLPTTEMVRPDLVLLDDPQTRESAESLTQNEKRLRLIMGDVLGMAGPGQKLAVLMPCTVIEPGDMIDQVLDRAKHPLWRGKRAGILRSMPTNLTAWGAYFEVYARCALKEPPDYTEANDYYRARRAELDAGAEAQWEARKSPDEVSAVQHAMHLYFRDPAAFWAEGMNQPQARTATAAAAALDPAQVAAKVSHLPPGMVPRGTTRLTAFIDVGMSLLWYVVCAWDERWNGGPITYGCYPEQLRAGFTGTDPRPGLGDLPAARGLPADAALYAGLTAVAAHILGRGYTTEETGAEVRVTRCLIDANYGPATHLVYDWCRRSPYAQVLLPSHGRFIGARSSPMANWPERQYEQRGPGWRRTPPSATKGGFVVFDANHWKTFTADRLRTPPGAAGCWYLPAGRPDAHRMFAAHCSAEYPVQVTNEGTGRTVMEWVERPGKPPNHLWDCLVGAAVAAGVEGLLWSAGGPAPPPPARERVSLKELRAKIVADKARARRASAAAAGGR